VISEIIDHMDYVVVIVIAVLLYRFIGRPLVHKV